MSDQTKLRARIEKAHTEVYALCGGKSWKMEIQWNYDTDSDLVITDGLKAGEDALDQLAALQAEIKDEQYVREKLANLLRRTAIVLKGPEPEMIRWDWSSIPEQVQALVAKIAAAEQEIARMRTEVAWLQGEAQDWQLAADGVKHHFGCENNKSTGMTKYTVCDRCRAEQAEARLAAVRETLDAVPVKGTACDCAICAGIRKARTQCDGQEN